MVRVIFSCLFCIFLWLDVYAQTKDHIDIVSYISLSIQFDSDTLKFADTLEVELELKNISCDTVHIYPEGVVFIEIDYPVIINKGLIQVSDRKTKKKRIIINPGQVYYTRYKTVVNTEDFNHGQNTIIISHITYPYWLNARDRSREIFGKLVSESSPLFVL